MPFSLAHVHLGDVPTWVAALAAALAVVYAARAFRSQGKQIEQQEKVNEAQTEALKVQLAEIRAVQERRERDDLERLRGQARLVQLDEVLDGSPEAGDDPGHRRLVVRGFNSSSSPIAEALSHLVSDDRKVPGSDYYFNRIHGAGHFSAQVIVDAGEIPANSRLYPILEFNDMNGVKWRIDDEMMFEYQDPVTGTWVKLTRWASNLREG